MGSRSVEAAIYTRISTDSTGAGAGVARQEAECRKLAEGKGWNVREVFTDNDVSATRAKVRPAYEAMIAALEEGTIQAVVVWDVDRLTRKPMELETFIELADAHKVQLASASGEIDLATEQGRLMARMKGSIARYEAEQMSRRIRAQKASVRAAGGVTTGGARPFGFEADRVTVRESEAAEIRHAVNMILNHGWSMSAVLRDFENRGVQTIYGNKWKVNTFRTMITNPRLAGKITHKGEIVGDAPYNPIISLEDQSRLRSLIETRAKHLAPYSRARKHHWTNLIVCELCGMTMGVAPAKHVKAGGIRRCLRERGGCGSVAITQEVDQVLDELFLDHLDRLAESVPEAPEEGSREYEIEKRIAELEGRLLGLAEAFANDDGSDPLFFREAAKKIENKINDARSELDQDRLAQEQAHLRRSPTEWRTLWEQGTVEDRSRLLHLFIDKVIITPRTKGWNQPGVKLDRIKVQWKTNS